MEYKFDLTDKVKDFLNGAETSEIDIGCSNSQVVKISKDSVFYLKIAALGELTNEYKKLQWLSGKVKVPEIVLYETNNDVEYLITKAIPGEMVCSDYYLTDDNWKLGIPIIIEAFKELYEVDIKDCPFNVSLNYKLALIKSNIENNFDKLEISDHVLEKFRNPENIYKHLVENRFKEELCFSHGDISLPNIFTLNNEFTGFIDVGDCGIADKWFDIAIAVRTIKRNYGEKAVDEFFKQLGVKKDNNKINYYLLLMELYL